MSKERFEDIMVEVSAWLFVGALIAFIVIALSGCTTEKIVTVEDHSYSKMTEMVDSLMRSTTSWQNDFLLRQTSLIEKLSQKEKNDSIHFVTLNEKGDTLKEKIVIYKEVSKDHSTERKEIELLISQYKRIDSLLNVSLVKQAETDSLLRAKETVVEVPAQLSWWQSLRIWIGNIFLLIVAACLCYFGWRMWKVYKYF
jgi:hypothetical protein